MGQELKQVSEFEITQNAEDPQDVAPQGIAPLAHMIGTGQMSIEQVEKMMDLQDRWEASEAKKAYINAMARFREDLKPARKSGRNGHLKTTYATFDDIVRAVSMPLSSHGFNYSFKQDQSEKGALTVTCTITHKGGHSESTVLTSTVEGNKGINSLQALGLTASYLKRYTLTALTGVATEDSDGEVPPPEPMCGDVDFADIRAACESVGKEYDSWVNWKAKSIPVIDGKLQLARSQKQAAIAQISRAAK